MDWSFHPGLEPLKADYRLSPGKLWEQVQGYGLDKGLLPFRLKKEIENEGYDVDTTLGIKLPPFPAR